MSQAQDLHRALLRPAVIYTLRAAGFSSTKPSVLDTLTNIAERYLLLLASSTAQHARSAHNDAVPTVTDVRMALTDCGVLTPVEGAAEEQWTELMRVPVVEMGAAVKEGGQQRMRAEKRKREEGDLRDVKGFQGWLDGNQHQEVKRIAGMVPDASTSGAGTMPTVGVGGGVVQAEDLLSLLKKKSAKAGTAEDRLLGTVLGQQSEDREVLVEGGPVQRVREWRPRLQEASSNDHAASTAPKQEAQATDSS